MEQLHARRWRDLAESVDGRRTAFEIAAALQAAHAPVSVFDGLNQLATLGLIAAGDGPVRWTEPSAGTLAPLLDRVVRAVVPRTPEACPITLVTAVPWAGRGWRGAAGSAPCRRKATLAALGESAERDALVWRGERPVVRRRGDDGVMLDWVAARALGSGREILQPAAACWRLHPDGLAANSSGCASGPTMDDAVERGFLELVERDAIGFWWRLRSPRPGIPLESVTDDAVAAAASWLESLGRSLHLLDLTTELRVPVVAALSWDRAGRRVGMGFAARWSVRDACRRAVCEMVSAWTAMEAITDPNDSKDQAAACWLATASTDRDRHLVPAGEHAAGPGGPGRWQEVAERHGLEVLTVDMTSAETNIPIARVIVPDLITPWQVKATPRLREVPARMGWTVAAEPNPARFFL